MSSIIYSMVVSNYHYLFYGLKINVLAFLSTTEILSNSHFPDIQTPISSVNLPYDSFTLAALAYQTHKF